VLYHHEGLNIIRNQMLTDNAEIEQVSALDVREDRLIGLLEA
jgi:hypothetical protein